MATGAGDSRDEVALPTVVRDLLVHLGSGQLVGPSDAKRAWQASATPPGDAAAAVDALVAEGLITATQGTLLRKTFTEAQRAQLAAMLDTARGRGLVSMDDAERVASEFDAAALRSSPAPYLTELGLLTAAQAESLRSGAETAASSSQQAVSSVPAAAGSGSAQAVSDTEGAIRWEYWPKPVLATVAGLMGTLGMAIAASSIASWHYTFVDYRSLLDMKVVAALVWAPVATHVLASHLELPKRLAFFLAAYAVCGLGSFEYAPPVALAAMRWLDGRPATRGRDAAVAFGLGVGVVALFAVILRLAAAVWSQRTLERSMYGQGDEWIVFCIVTVPRGLIGAASALAAGWCMQGGVRFQSPQDVGAHVARATWALPMVAFAVGAVLSALVSVATDDSISAGGFGVCLLFGAGGVAWARMRLLALHPALQA